MYVSGRLDRASTVHCATLRRYVPSRYSNFRLSPTVFSNCTVAPESNALYIRCAFRACVAHARLHGEVVRP